MKLWILRPKEGLTEYNNPWYPWFDKVFGFVVCAETEADAREMAHNNAGEENDNEFLGQKTSFTTAPWKNAEYSTCIEMLPGTVPEILMRDFARA